MTPLFSVSRDTTHTTWTVDLERAKLELPAHVHFYTYPHHGMLFAHDAGSTFLMQHELTFSFMQSDSDSSRPRTPSGVAKPPGAGQIRYESESPFQ